jgi:hypothetical protein
MNPEIPLVPGDCSVTLGVNGLGLIAKLMRDVMVSEVRKSDFSFEIGFRNLVVKALPFYFSPSCGHAPKLGDQTNGRRVLNTLAVAIPGGVKAQHPGEARLPLFFS